MNFYSFFRKLISSIDIGLKRVEIHWKYKPKYRKLKEILKCKADEMIIK